MKGIIKKTVILGMTVAVTGASLVTSTGAEPTDPVYVKEGTYSYNGTGKDERQLEDNYIYRDDCFMRSSYLGCEHLTLLSAQVSMASGNKYDDGSTDYTHSGEENASDITNMLTDMGFKDVAINNYYSETNVDNPAAVTVGHRKITAGGKDYTLLVIVARGTGDEKGWIGNFTSGAGDVHSSFKDARDEDLRFTKKYIQDNNISGDLKVWITGHSRGGAVGNLLGGFFAGGGIDYFGENVSITPEDVYCYTFATPKVIKDGISKNEILSVSAPRGGEYAAFDTPGEAYAYEAGGTVSIKDEMYSGIQNFPLSYDIVTYLLPDLWGFDRYGKEADPEKNGDIPEADMASFLSALDPDLFAKYEFNGSPKDFRTMTFDVKNLVPAPDGKAAGKQAMVDFINEKLAALASVIPDNETYVTGGYEATARAVAGLYVLLKKAGALEQISAEGKTFIMPLVYSVMADASEKLQAEGRAADEGEAVAIALEEILTFITGEAVAHETFTVDQAVEMIAKYIADNKDTPAVQNLMQIASEAIPETYRGMLTELLKIYCKNPEEAALGDALYAFIKAMAYGAEEGSAAYNNEEMRSPAYNRRALYSMVYLVIASKVPDYPDIIGRDDEGNMNGSGSFTGLAKMILSLLLTTKDADGNEMVFENAAQAADFSLRAALSALSEKLRTAMEQAGISEEIIQREFDGRVAVLMANVTSIRKLLFNVFADTPGVPYSIENSVGNITTLITNISLFPTEHYNVMYTSWAKAGDKNNVNDHYITHVKGTPATCIEAGVHEHWVYTDAESNVSFTDQYLTEIMTDKEMIIPATGHEWGEWSVIKEATESEEGLERRVCKHNPEHMEERAIEKLKPESPSDSGKKDDPSDTSGNNKPSTPADPGNGQNSKGSGTVSPASGDMNNAAIWIVAGTAAAATAVIFAVRRRKRED